MNTITLQASSSDMIEQAQSDINSLLTQYGLNLIHIIGSPGSGKTAFIKALLEQNFDKNSTAVITASPFASIDAELFDQTGIQTVHVLTPETAILDAGMLFTALNKLELHTIKWIFVENVGSLLLPDNYSMSASLTVLVFSVAEGTNKPLKYSAAFKHADTVFVNKIDLLPFTNFDLKKCSKHIYTLNPSVLMLNGSATRSSTMESVWEHLQRKINEKEAH